MTRPIRALVALTALLCLLAPAPPAAAQDAGAFEVELNKLEPAGPACRTYFVFRNGTEMAVSNLRLDLFLFDAEGVILSRVAIDSEAVAPGRTRVRVFELAGLDCGAIGSLLMNGVMACEGEMGPLSGCVGRLSVSSRAEAELLD